MPSSKEHYVPLAQGSPSDSDEASVTETTTELRHSRRRQTPMVILLVVCCTCLLLAVVGESVYIFRLLSHIENVTKFDASYHSLSIGGIVPRVANVHSDFDSADERVAAAAWENIEAGHGDVLIDPKWAAEQGLPPSFEHPFVPGKSVYVIEAYHAMHCLKVLRNHYMAMHSPTAASLAKSEWPLEHDVHCFDSLRQHIMCHADYTLLYSQGHHDAGVKQERMCRDWDALRDWATERSAHWKDHINPNPKGEIWWHFDDGGDDGLPRGSLS